MNVRVLIVDDHPIFVDGLRSALEGAPEVEVVGEAGDGDEALAAVAELEPDVVLMDLTMPGRSGIEVTREVLAARPRTRVLVLTMQADDEAVLAAVRAGAAGYLLKGSDRAAVLRAIAAVAAGEAVFGTAVSARLLSHLSHDRPAAPFPDLTPRERELLDHVARGLGNQAIAQLLHLSPKTIRNNVSALLTKLGAADRAAAIEMARRQGLGQV